jgi:hypothetical protein
MRYSGKYSSISNSDISPLRNVWSSLEKGTPKPPSDIPPPWVETPFAQDVYSNRPSGFKQSVYHDQPSDFAKSFYLDQPSAFAQRRFHSNEFLREPDGKHDVSLKLKIQANQQLQDFTKSYNA